jgi:hypothetical protein
MSMRQLPSRRMPGELSLPSSGSMVWPLAAMALLAGLHISNALGRAINWDEFYHLSQLNELLAGTLTKPMQTLLMRLFSWVTWLPGDNIDHILAARGAMFAVTLGCAGAIYALAHGFASRKAALASALAWLSAGFVLQHATSFRTDALAAALLMASLAMMARSRLDIPSSLAVAALAGLAALLTIKSVLYAPAFAGIAFLRWQQAGRTRDWALRLAGLALMVPVMFGAFYALHSAFLPGEYDSAAMVSGSAGKMFPGVTFPYAHHALKAAATAPVLALALLAAPVLLWRDKAFTRDEKIALAGLLLPVSSVAFYHNSAAYYYVFILAPVAVGCVVALTAAIARYSLAAVSAVCLLGALAVFATEERETLGKQRQIVAAADQIFDQPVAYFDFPGMLGHFPKANGFLTPWGADSYRKGFGETMAEALTHREVPLVIENDPAFTEALRGTGPATLLLPADAALLRETYIHFWGPYWLAGVEVGARARIQALIRVPGNYTVVGNPVSVDGMQHFPGEVLHLDRGQHQIAAYGEPARLLWGDRLKQPDMPAPPEPYWTQF